MPLITGYFINPSIHVISSDYISLLLLLYIALYYSVHIYIYVLNIHYYIHNHIYIYTYYNTLNLYYILYLYIAMLHIISCSVFSFRPNGGRGHRGGRSESASAHTQALNHGLREGHQPRVEDL